MSVFGLFLFFCAAVDLLAVLIFMQVCRIRTWQDFLNWIEYSKALVEMYRRIHRGQRKVRRCVEREKFSSRS